MRVLITNNRLGFGEGAIMEQAQEYSKEYGGYIGYINGVKCVVDTEDGAIIVEDDDESYSEVL